MSIKVRIFVFVCTLRSELILEHTFIWCACISERAGGLYMHAPCAHAYPCSAYMQMCMHQCLICAPRAGMRHTLMHTLAYMQAYDIQYACSSVFDSEACGHALCTLQCLHANVHVSVWCIIAWLKRWMTHGHKIRVHSRKILGI
jgi:hypothetical protein